MKSRIVPIACALMITVGLGTAKAAESLTDGIHQLQTEWARIKYDTPDEKSQLNAIHRLETQAETLSRQYPDSAEVMIWQGIILSTDAGIVRGFSALGKVKDARSLFEKAIKTNPAALDGSAYTSLGSLYYQVPSWPLAFGSDTKAEENLKKALELNPDGIDPNFFYGDFLLQAERYDEAKKYLQHALNAPARPDRPAADAGRRMEIAQALEKLSKKQSE